jgi:1-acyl-sn-glycerol-3-phosphate acyltransferase
VSDASQFSLLKERRFAPFFATQFLGAFNDNIFRNGLIIVITFQGVNVFGLGASQLANVAGAMFILPFFLFSATSGQLADKYEKSRLMRIIKAIEISLMVLAAIAFMNHSYAALFAVLFLMGCQSTLFGPAKYAYLPQQLGTTELIGGNALVESGTYLAIIFGLIIGGISVAIDPGEQYVLSACLIGVAIFGYLASRGIPETRAVDPHLRINWNVWAETWRIVSFAREDRSVYLAILGISWFWFFGSAMTLQIPAYTLDIMNGNEKITTMLLVTFAVGVGIGSLLCERLSGHRIELGLVPFGSIGLSVFAIDLYFAQSAMHNVAVTTVLEFVNRPGSVRILADLTMLGAFGGLYSVPMYAMIQARAKRQHLSRIIAANNIINAIFMVAAAVFALALLYAGLSIPEFFAVLGLMNVAVAIYIYTLVPEFLMRFIAWILVNTLYRIRTSGSDHIPESGPAILVCNHVSYVDALVLSGSVRRPVRFVMWYRIFDIPFLKFLFRSAKAIPIASAKEDAALLEHAFNQIDEGLADGDLICIFPEGGITRDGEIQSFRPGVEKIIARQPVPVIPIALGGLWGSWFSRHHSGRLRRIPGKLFCRVDVRIGDPVKPADASTANLEVLVRTLRGKNR